MEWSLTYGIKVIWNAMKSEFCIRGLVKPTSTKIGGTYYQRNMLLTSLKLASHVRESCYAYVIISLFLHGKLVNSLI